MAKLFSAGLMTSLAVAALLSTPAKASDLRIGQPAPLFKLQTHEGKPFDLASRKGHWTVLYFYPKAETPGCTKQACAFRDSLEKIRKLDAEVYGVSSDNVEALAKFHKNHRLNFVLLADPTLEVIKSYGVKMPLLSMSKRHTFVIDPELKIRSIDENVDPVKDPEKVAQRIQESR